MVALCAEPADDRPTTWINPVIRASYDRLFQLGHAHSIECWLDGELVGGLYGVTLGRAFFGESMVSRARDASKVALAQDRKSVVEGKSVSVRVDLGGRRIIKKKKIQRNIE